MSLIYCLRHIDEIPKAYIYAFYGGILILWHAFYSGSAYKNNLCKTITYFCGRVFCRASCGFVWQSVGGFATGAKKFADELAKKSCAY